ncbi:hypothetical protein KFL_000930340 [Klebsormidium nitens]|uniref:Bacterial Ig-like domain-containing protein n=1 Tax=Klebsormidium nitens TaxID=105231 RepID=A0A1Y1I194_KLENI|nr:hypothetical protein KFL_000930340 [Klebsormidium nitens]|eukprot:GAQ81888.1 hypothetical protein KFL_000930340 [Klebsormidium nitens]
MVKLGATAALSCAVVVLFATLHSPRALKRSEAYSGFDTRWGIPYLKDHSSEAQTSKLPLGIGLAQVNRKPSHETTMALIRTLFVILAFLSHVSSTPLHEPDTDVIRQGSRKLLQLPSPPPALLSPTNPKTFILPSPPPALTLPATPPSTITSLQTAPAPTPAYSVIPPPPMPIPTVSEVSTESPILVVTQAPAANVIAVSSPALIEVPGLPGAFQPTDHSELLRTVRNLNSEPGTAEYEQWFTTPTPANLGGVSQFPPVLRFSKSASLTVPFELDPATAALCGPTCTAVCQVDDAAPEPCGNTRATFETTGLDDGDHRVTAAFYSAPGASAPVALLSTFVTVDTTPPTISIALEADVSETPKIFVDASGERQTVFMAWDSQEPCPGYAVASEPVGLLTSDAFNLENARLVNFREDTSAAGRRRALLQATGDLPSGPIAYSFQIVPIGTGPLLIRIGVNPANVFDRAGNPLQLSAASSYVLYHDSAPPTAFLQLVNKDPNGVVALSTEPGVSRDQEVTLVLTFDKKVFGFDANTMAITNGTIIRAGPNAATADGFSYVLTVLIDRKANLVIQVPADSAFSIVGTGNTASNQLQVLHYEVNKGLQTGIRAVAVASVGVMAAGGIMQQSSSLLINVASSLSLFAARQSLDAPLPTPYIDASSALAFSLFRWPSPFDGIAHDSPIPYTDRPQALGSGVPANGILAATSERNRRALLQAVTLPANGTSGTVPANTKLLNQARPRTFYSGGNVSFEASPAEYSKELSINSLSLFQQPGHNGLRSLLRVMFWVTVILFALCVLHLLKGPLSRCLGKNASPAFLAFPALELTFFSIAIVGLGYVALGAIVGASPWGITLGLLVLMVILGFFLFVLSILARHVMMSKSVAFVSEQHRAGGGLAAWFRAPFRGTWEPVDSESGDLFLAKYGFFFSDYCGRPSELLSIAPHLSVSTSRKGAPSGLSFKGGPVEDAEGLLTGGSPPIAEAPLEGTPKSVDDAGAKFIDIEEAKEPALGEAKPQSPTRGDVSNEAPGKVVRVRRRLGNMEFAYYTKPKSSKKLLEAAPGIPAPGTKLLRSQSSRTVHRVGKVGVGAHLRPGWKMMYLLVVAIEAALLGATYGVRASYWQLCFLVAMRALLVIVLFLLKPFVVATLQLAELFSCVCELAVVTLAFALVIKQDVSPEGRLRKNEEALGYTMIALQLLAVFSNVVNTLVSLTLKAVAWFRGKATALPVHF